jgi:tripartite-type tricarboxylate transporter receptor subunit TctC
MNVNLTRRSLSAALIAGATGMTRLPAFAQAGGYPDKPIKLILPFSASAVTAAIARFVTDGLQTHFRQPFVHDYRPGASGIVGMAAVAKSPADGYTMLFGTTGIVQNSTIYKTVPYEPFKDFQPITRIASSAQAFVTGASTPFNSLKAFIEAAKKKPTSFASIGVGTTAHLYGELLAQKAGIDLLHVAYKTESQALIELVNGEVAGAFVTVGTASAQAKNGLLRVLACTGPQRAALLPETPTLAELGFSGFETVGWSSLFFPAGVPRDIVDKVSVQTNLILRDPVVAARVLETGFEVKGSTPEELTALMRKDFDFWAGLIKRYNIQPI